MFKNFKCPKCGAINEQCYDDCIDEEDYGNKLFKKYIGGCAACNADLIWWEEYEFKGYGEDIKII